MDAGARLGWVRLYEEVGDAGLVCRRCGISRPTLRKWWRRYQAEGEAGLETRSRRPHHSYRPIEIQTSKLRLERSCGGMARKEHCHACPCHSLGSVAG